MKQYHGLPENLQALILQSGITIQDDKKTVRTVMNILDLRNGASHPSPGLFEEEVVMIRNFLFKDGGLRSLINGFYHMVRQAK
jgi:hypothetical protein